MCAGRLARSPLTRMHLYILKGMYSFAELLFQCMRVLTLLLFFCSLLSTIVSTTWSARGLAYSGAKKAIYFAEPASLLRVLRRIRFMKLSFWKGRWLWDLEMQQQQLWQHGAFKSRKIIFHLNKESLKIHSKSRENLFFLWCLLHRCSNCTKKLFFRLPFFVSAPYKQGAVGVA